MSRALAAREPARDPAHAARQPAARRLALSGGLVLLVLLGLGGAAISGFTLPRRLDPLDEGVMMQAAQRVAGGQVPYRDFRLAYGPGQPYLLAGLFQAFGPSVVGWRIVRVLVDAAVALAAFVLVRRAAPSWVAVLGWLATAAAIAQPTSASPSAPALALALGALFVATGGGAPSARRGAAAGLLVALAAWWRPDFGAFALLAAGAALATRAGPARGRALGGLGASAVGVAVVLYVPFAIAAGLPRLWQELVGNSAADGAWWSLPFPWAYGGPLRGWPPGALAHDLKDLARFYVPLAAFAGLGIGAVALARRRAALAGFVPSAVGLLALGAGLALYERSRADEFHVQPLVVVAVALLPALAWRLWRASSRVFGGVLAAAFLLLLIAGATDRLAALVRPPRLEPVDLAVARGIEVPPAEARALPRLVEVVDARVAPREPIYVAPRRSDLVAFADPLLYFLTQRPNPLREDFALQARPAEQSRLVTALARLHPRVVVRWTDRLSERREPNRRGRSTGDHALDDLLAAEYRLLRRIGAYDVLVPR